MKRFYYDLHIHSCLSPCGDNGSTPDSILGMGELNQLDIMALTDHNSVKNCPAFFKAAERHGIVPIAGMELTTAEDIHIVCLFETLQNALAFGEEIETRRIPVKNRSDIFGEQLILDDEDNIIGEEENLLINATTVSLEEAPKIVRKYGGAVYPAHIDREANGIIAVLGSFPETPCFRFAELHNRELIGDYRKLANVPKNEFLISSDAHYLWDIKERCEYFELECEIDSNSVRRTLFEYLRCEK